MPIPTGDTLFPSVNVATVVLEHQVDIHLVDCRKVEMEGIIQHRQLHPDTVLSASSLGESPIVHVGTCVWGGGGRGVSLSLVSIVELMGTGCLLYGAHLGVV